MTAVRVQPKTAIRPIDQMHAALSNLYHLFEEHGGDPESDMIASEIIDHIWGLIRDAHENYQGLQAFVSSQQGMIDELTWQRDITIRDLESALRDNAADARARVALDLAFEFDIPAEAVDRALGALTGESDVPVSKYTLRDVRAAFDQLIIEMEEERAQQQAEAEEEGF